MRRSKTRQVTLGKSGQGMRRGPSNGCKACSCPLLALTCPTPTERPINVSKSPIGWQPLSFALTQACGYPNRAGQQRPIDLPKSGDAWNEGISYLVGCETAANIGAGKIHDKPDKKEFQEAETAARPGEPGLSLADRRAAASRFPLRRRAPTSLPPLLRTPLTDRTRTLKAAAGHACRSFDDRQGRLARPSLSAVINPGACHE